MTNLSADAKQIGGSHYKTDYQHWSMLPALGYHYEYYVGQATKYISRWKKKNGLRDILKGQHFIEKLIELVQERGAAFLPYGHVAERVELELLITDHYESHLKFYFASNEIDKSSAAICMAVMFANSQDMLVEALAECRLLAETERMAEQQKADLEAPVSKNFAFLGYVDGGIAMRWLCLRCKSSLELAMDQPPNTTHHCAAQS